MNIQETEFDISYRPYPPYKYGSKATVRCVALDCKSSPFAVNIGGAIPSASTSWQTRP